MQSPNIFDLFRFLEIQRSQIVAGYDMLRDDRLTSAERHVVLIGLLVALGSFHEGLNVAAGLNPDLESLRDRFTADTSRWYRLRHDVAHIFERVFASPRSGQNVPWIPGGLRVATYEKATDVVATGADPNASIVLGEAVEKAFELLSARATDQSQRPGAGLSYVFTSSGRRDRTSAP